MKLYFAYGANLNKKSMQQRCPAAIPLRAAILNNWTFRFAGVATVVPCVGSRVYGALWSITKECEQSLDSFEAYPWLYHKVVTQIDGEEVMLYRMSDEDSAPPSKSYYNTIVTGYHDWGLPMEKLELAHQQANKQDDRSYFDYTQSYY